MINEKSCGAVVYREIEGIFEYLLICHLRDGHWCFPKGHVEEEESEKETAIREVKEEVGLDVELLEDFRTSIEYCPRKGIMKEVVFFIGKPLAHDVSFQIEEIRDYRWLDFEEAQKLITYSDSKDVLKQANNYLTK